MTQENNFNDMNDRIINDPILRISLARKSHLWFFNMYFAHYVKYETAPFQKELFGLTEDDGNKMAVISAFRGSGKSTILTTSYPIWSILGYQQKKFVVILSQTEEKAEQYLMNIKKELETNELLKADLGPFHEERGQWGISSLLLDNFNARIKVGSVGQSIRSLRHQQYRPDLIIVDDCEDLVTAKVKENRDKTYEWFKGEVLPAGDKNTRIMVIGNLLHQDCLVMRLKGEIEDSSLSGIAKWFPVIKNDGSIAWPGKYPDMNAIEEEKKKIGNERVWMREYMLEIVSNAEQIILPEWLEKYQYEKMPGFDSPDYKGTYLGVDPAVSEKDDACKTGIVIASVFGSGENTKIYIHPYLVNQGFSFCRLVEEIIYLCQNVGPKNRVIPIIENVAAQKWLYDELKKLGIRAELFEIHGIEKSERLKISALAVEGGMVFFPNHCRGIEELKTQLIGFGSERFNDLADAFSIAVNRITENRNGGFSFVRAEGGRSFEEFKRGVSSTPKTDLPWKNDAELRELEKKLDLEIHNKQIEEASWPGVSEERREPAGLW